MLQVLRRTRGARSLRIEELDHIDILVIEDIVISGHCNGAKRLRGTTPVASRGAHKLENDAKRLPFFKVLGNTRQPREGTLQARVELPREDREGPTRTGDHITNVFTLANTDTMLTLIVEERNQSPRNRGPGTGHQRVHTNRVITVAKEL
jgi:hypothetical protein